MFISVLKISKNNNGRERLIEFAKQKLITTVKPFYKTTDKSAMNKNNA